MRRWDCGYKFPDECNCRQLPTCHVAFSGWISEGEVALLQSRMVGWVPEQRMRARVAFMITITSESDGGYLDGAAVGQLKRAGCCLVPNFAFFFLPDRSSFSFCVIVLTSKIDTLAVRTVLVWHVDRYSRKVLVDPRATDGPLIWWRSCLASLSRRTRKCAGSCGLWGVSACNRAQSNSK